MAQNGRMTGQFRYLVTVSRPRFWLYLGGTAVLGAAWGIDQPVDLLDPTLLVVIAYFLLPANVYLYGVNDIFDASIDRQNPKKQGERETTYRGDQVLPAAVVGTGVLGVALLPFVGRAAQIAILGFLVLGAAYSVPPIRFKTTPLLDSVSNGLYILPGIATYGMLTGAWPPLLAVIGGWCWAMAMHTFSAIPDIEPDRAAGIETTATGLGYHRALAYCIGWWTVAAACFGLLHPLIGALFVVYPAFSIGLVIVNIPIDRAYWWFPWLNGVAGMTLTIAGMWVVLGG